VKVKWLNKALKNLDQEADCISKDNPEEAIKMVQRILDKVILLADNPSLGRPGRINGTRELIIDNSSYIIPYRINNNQIELLRVFHTSRKLPKRW
jgi:toxin ParE1/3/4